MIPILSTAQMRAADAFTIAHEPIASIDLMERASKAFVQWFVQQFDPAYKVDVVCGTGNNGGDGLAIARLLKDWNYHVNVWIISGPVKEPSDFVTNKKRLPESITVTTITDEINVKSFNDRHVIIDAIFGSGLSRPTEGIYANTIEVLNQLNITRVAVDIPSGLQADGPSAGSIFKAHHTVTFQSPKLAFLLPEYASFVGQWHVVEIGLHPQFLQNEATKHFLVTKKAVLKLLPRREKFSHKGTFGRALLMAGSYGKIGACILAARAIMRSGTGLLTAHVPSSAVPILQTAVPEAMCSSDAHEHYLSVAPPLTEYNALGIGPGLGQAAETVKFVQAVLEAGKPLVIDADALNILGAHPHLLHLVPAGSLLTPHPKEFERLAGSWKNSFERLEKQAQLARQLNSVVLVKGAYTAVATPQGEIFFNTTGNPGMATGGSGDVLTGILTGLMAQGLAAAHAATLGVYLHGLAGDLAAHDKTQIALIASDLIDYLPAALRTISG